ELIEAGLSQIPEDCTYAKVVNAVLEVHRKNPDDYKSCLKFLQDNWGYDKYTGVCHIIPNAGVCVLSMLYGKSFARSIEIATMCGWDTDCNAGNVGTIMGVADGLRGIAPHYRNPINDSVVLSGVSGYLNILDIPTYTKELALLGYRLAGEEAPADNLRLSNKIGCSLRHSTERAYRGNGSVEILFDRMSRGQKCKIYYKPFYRREDYDDERYMPVFSPTAYPGQTVSMMVYVDRYSGESIILNPYVRNTSTKQDVLLGGTVIKEPGWRKIEFIIPELDGAMVDEIGLLFEANSPEKNRDFGCLYIDDFSITGKASYTIDISKQKKEFASITTFSHNHGAWEMEKGVMEAMCLEHAEAMTGNYYMTDVRVIGKIIPHTGKSHLISVRVQGTLRGYYGGFVADGVALFCNNNGMKQLAACPFDWEYEREYTVEIKAQGDQLTFAVDGKQLLQVTDNTHAYGMAGYAMYDIGRSGFGNLSIDEL
ncbi:MAG: hypothetical protein K0R80_2288, partial [Clostridia bacterium]|nr:hypothetical protein [Clostridia bacterium]